MLLPIYAYGQSVLKQVAKNIDATYENLPALIVNMWQTMYDANGVGIAAPQVGLAIRLFVIDTIQIEDDERKPDFKGFKKVFINAQILEQTGKEWGYEEGCLSIPNVRGEVMRKETIKIRYQDENFVEHTETFSGVNARVIQHEYDHIEGVLFVEKLNPVKRNLVRPKLDNIRRGKVKDVDYKMKFANIK